MARRVTPRIAGFRPGTSPPPVRMPMTPRFVLTLARTLGSPSRCVTNTKLSPAERSLGRVKAGDAFLRTNGFKYLVWRSQFDFCAQDSEKLCEPGGVRGPSWRGDKVAVSNGLGHCQIDVRAAGLSDVGANGGISAAFSSLQDASGSKDLRSVANGRDGFVSP